MLSRTPNGADIPALSKHGEKVLAFLPWADRFEDFHDKIDVSLEQFRDGLTGTWLFNYVDAFQSAGVRPVLYFMSVNVPDVTRFTHRATGADVRFLPSPWLHRKLQGARDRFHIESPLCSSVLSYAATPWRTLAKELKRDRCDAIICQEYEFPRFDEAVVLGRTLGVPVFATYQGANAPGSILERPFRRLAVRGAAGLIIASRTEIERVHSRYGVAPERMALIPNAFDTERWRPGDRRAARLSLDIPVDARVVVWQGRVEVHRKGLDILIDAWARLFHQRPSDGLLLLLVGSGQDEDVFRQRLAELPATAVRWVNRYLLDRDLLWRYLMAADVATLPSRHEGFAVTVIEAMACGLPVVASNVSGVPEALGEDPVGVIVPSEDPGALAEAFGRLLDDEPLRRRLGERARNRAEHHFSTRVVGDKLRGFMHSRGAFRDRPNRG